MSFLFINKTLRLSNLKTRTAMNAKNSVFVICVEVIIYWSQFHILYDWKCRFTFSFIEFLRFSNFIVYFNFFFVFNLFLIVFVFSLSVSRSLICIIACIYNSWYLVQSLILIFLLSTVRSRLYYVLFVRVRKIYI